MQDRTSAISMKVLLQRTAGPYMWVNSVGSVRCGQHVRFRSNCYQMDAVSRGDAKCQQRPFPFYANAKLS